MKEDRKHFGSPIFGLFNIDIAKIMPKISIEIFGYLTESVFGKISIDFFDGSVELF